MNTLIKNEMKGRIPIAVTLFIYVLASVLLPTFNGNSDGIFLIFGIIKMVPVILLGIYMLGMYKTQPIAPYIVFALLGTETRWFEDFYNVWYLLRYDSNLEEFTAEIVLSFLANVLMCIAIFLIVKCSKKGKIMLIVASAVFCTKIIAASGISLDSVVYILFYVAMILCATFNDLTIGAFRNKQRTCEEEIEVSPDQALKVLQDTFDLGFLTEEEYRAKRTEIISKL